MTDLKWEQLYPLYPDRPKIDPDKARSIKRMYKLLNIKPDQIDASRQIRPFLTTSEGDEIILN